MVMESRLRKLAGKRFDLVVIGGGINGAAIAQRAAVQGWRVLLVEREDFGSGTTSRSTRLIHGGLRYLEHGEFGLVYESLHEREALLRLAPDQVRPLCFVLPVYRGARHRRTTIGLGLFLYDLLSLGRSLPRHRRLSKSSLLRIEPALASQGLLGGFSYFDCQAVYPERICLEYVLAAQRSGAVVLNHCQAGAIHTASGRVRGLSLRDVLTDAETEIEACVIVNAAGPWVDEVLGRTGRPMRRRIGGTRGSHILVDYHGRGPQHAIYSEAGDGRPFFIIPWRSWHLIGTTDVRFDRDPTGVLPTDAEIVYLLDEANRRLPALSASAEDILYAFAGVRPLPYTHSGDEGSITRRHSIEEHAREGVAGLYSVVGGKLSTFRSLAKQAVERIGRLEGLPLSAGNSVLEASPFPAAPSVSPALAALERATRQHLLMLYGGRAGTVADLAASSTGLSRRLCHHGPDLAAEVCYAARAELALTVGDVLLRRTGAGWNPCLGLDSAEEVARILANERGCDERDVPSMVEAYRQELASTFRRPPGNTTPAPGSFVTDCSSVNRENGAC